jgi:acyl-CoA synthetase (AMP-forming)/AMP-acid ligase II
MSVPPADPAEPEVPILPAAERLLEYRTVTEAIPGTAARWPGHGYTFQDLKGDETFYSFAEVERETARRAGALQALGLAKGDRLGMVLIEPRDFVLTFLACLRVGVVPVPFYPPLGLGNFASYSARIGRLLESCGARMLFASRRLESVLWALVSEVPCLERLITDKHLERDHPPPVYPEIGADDVAFLQYTSGSTDDPKGVMITHGCLVANSEGILGSGGLQGDSSRDVGVTWLPLYHDMGLIGFVVAPLCFGISVIFIPTLRFLRDPTVWMETIHRHRATISFGPNFAYGFVARRSTPEQLARWDLSCLKVLGCGGEPVHPDTVRSFSERFAQHARMQPDLVRPGYGCAEGTLTTSLTPMNEGLRLNTVDADTFGTRGVAAPAREGRPVLTHVACGVPIPGHEVVVVDKDKKEHRLPDGVEGEILFRGPSVAPGYFHNEKATRETFRDGWLYTGDLGYLLDGHVYVTGRIKDLIIYHGRNYHPQSIEWPVGNLPGVRKGNVVAFSVPGEDSEEVVVVLERTGSGDGGELLIREVKRVMQAEAGLAAHDVVLLPKHRLPKTSSGKLQRRKTREMYLNGELGQAGSRMTVARTSVAELALQVTRSLWTRFRTRTGQGAR